MTLWSTLLLLLVLALTTADRIDQLLTNICDKHDLTASLKELLSFKTHDARRNHMIAALELILHSHLDAAVSWHKSGKALSPTTTPPLASLHLNGRICGGLGDLFYVAAVITKQMVDLTATTVAGAAGGAAGAGPGTGPSTGPGAGPGPGPGTEPGQNPVNASAQWFAAVGTLITLTSDSGLDAAAEAHWAEAVRIKTTTTSTTSTSDGSASDLLTLLFRGALLTPAVYSSSEHITYTRALLEARLNQVEELVASGIQLMKLDEFSLSTTFYLVYQGQNDRDFLSRLHRAYSTAYPALQKKSLPPPLAPPAAPSALMLAGATAPTGLVAVPARAAIRIGFVSNYFRRHSICKLFCGMITGLAKLSNDSFDVFLFSTLPAEKEDAMTQQLKQLEHQRSNFHFVQLGMFSLNNQVEVLHRQLDVLLYLDVGMEPAVVAWAAARLAPLQVCLWGHPTTTGLPHMDYFLSSELFHGHAAMHAQDAFSEQLLLLDSTGFAFPSLVELLPPQLLLPAHAPAIVTRNGEFYDLVAHAVSAMPASKARDTLLSLLEQIRHGMKLLLCPQFLPKMHPVMDSSLLTLLQHSPKHLLVMLDSEKKAAWKFTLLKRWRTVLTERLLVEQTAAGLPRDRKTVVAQAKHVLTTQIIWLPALNPAQYLLMLSLGSVMLDPFPFGGGVTALEAIFVGTPVLTVPSMQQVPQLAAGALDTLFNVSAPDFQEQPELRQARRLLVADNTEGFVTSALRLLEDATLAQQVRALIFQRKHVLFGEESVNSQNSIADWAKTFKRLVA